ncbi:hypothetical protein IO386_001502, partial [Campylobacter lari]|nr:hypothetical protein [Campylobacter lari]
ADTSWDDKNNKIKLNQIKADSIDLKGNEVYVDISTINSKNLTTEAKNKGIAYLSATGYYYNPTRKYDEFNNVKLKKTYNQYISIGSDLDWWHFAKGWNEKEAFRNTASEYRLTNDIDFKASSGQNYANYWIDLNGDGKKDANEFTNMIVGLNVANVGEDEYYKYKAFTKTFDGQGYTLKNINIDTTGLSNVGYAGIFGESDGANFKNINVDYKNGGINAKNSAYVGGFIGLGTGSTFDKISLSNISNILSKSEKGSFTHAGGFSGAISQSNVKNISIDKIQNIKSQHVEKGEVYAGGFSGVVGDSSLDGIRLSQIDNIEALNLNSDSYAGGFAGTILGGKNVDNIYIDKIDNIISKGKYRSHSGGFTGKIEKTNTSNVILNNIGTIEAIGNAVSASINVGGFAGYISGGREFMYIKDIALENIDSIIAINTAGGSQYLYAGGFAGKIGWMANDGYISHVKLNNINNIKSGSEDKIDSNIGAGGFVGGVETSENFNIKDIVVKNINHIYTGKSSLSASDSGGFAGNAFLNGWENVFFRNIYIENIGDITSNDNSGGFIGSNSYGETNYVDITLKGIDNIQSTRNSGGFVGFNRGGKYSKIYISDIKNISSKSIDKFDDLSNSYNAYTGGFVGLNDYGKFSDITVKNIGNISSVSNVSIDAYASAGGFVGNIFSGDFERISLENINNINSIASSSNSYSGAYSGGFAGSNITYNNGADKSTYNINNISLKGIKNITSEAKSAYAGGFAGKLANNYSGDSSSINFLKNIYIEGIDHIKANGGLDAQAGGFAGSLDYVDIDNVELNNIKEIKAESLGKKAFSTFAGGFVGFTNRYLNFENIVLNNFGSISAKDSKPHNNYAGGFVGFAFNGVTEITIIFNNISLNNFGSIIGEGSVGGFVGSDRGIKMSNISLNDIHYIQGASAGGFSGHADSSYENIVLNNIKHIKGVYAGGFTGSGRGGKNIYIYFDKGAIIEGSESSGKFFGRFDNYSDTENTYIYYHKDDLTNANTDQKYWELYKWIELHPYDDNSQGYIDFKTAALAALNGLKEIDCGAGKKCLVFTKDFEIEKPSNPNISEPNYPNNVVVSKPSQNTDYIPNTEDIINEKVVLDENDLYKDIIINEIIADLKDKYYTIDIADLKAILEAYKNLDKNSAEARTKFIMDYFFDKNNKDNPSMEIAQKEIFQSLDFLLAYQDNGLDKAGDDKFASKEAIQAKNDILTEVSNALENKTITNNLEKLNNLNDKINSANNDFKEKNYYKQLN